MFAFLFEEFMIKLYRLFIIGIFIAIFISNCSDNATNPTESKGIWPLKVGNYWKYSKINYDESGSITKTDSIGISVLKDTIFNNQTLYYLINNGEVMVLVKRNDGIYMYNPMDLSQSGLLLKFPCLEGESFFNINEDTMTFVSKDFDYQFKFGNYKCYQYLMEREYSVSEILFVPEIGYMGETVFRKNPDGTKRILSKSILTDYKVN